MSPERSQLRDSADGESTRLRGLAAISSRDRSRAVPDVRFHAIAIFGLDCADDRLRGAKACVRAPRPVGESDANRVTREVEPEASAGDSSQEG